MFVVLSTFVGARELYMFAIGVIAWSQGGTARKLYFQAVALLNVLALAPAFLNDLPYSKQWLDGDVSGVYNNLVIAVVFAVGGVVLSRGVEETDDVKQDAGALATNAQRLALLVNVVFGAYTMIAPAHALAQSGIHTPQGVVVSVDAALFLVRVGSIYMLVDAFYRWQALQRGLQTQASALFLGALINLFELVLMCGGTLAWETQHGDPKGAWFGIAINFIVAVLCMLGYKQVNEQL